MIKITGDSFSQVFFHMSLAHFTVCYSAPKACFQLKRYIKEDGLWNGQLIFYIDKCSMQMNLKAQWKRFQRTFVPNLDSISLKRKHTKSCLLRWRLWNSKPSSRSFLYHPLYDTFVFLGVDPSTGPTKQIQGNVSSWRDLDLGAVVCHLLSAYGGMIVV